MATKLGAAYRRVAADSLRERLNTTVGRQKKLLFCLAPRLIILSNPDNARSRAPDNAGFYERSVGKGSQDDFNDAKIWLEPEIEVARPGRTLKRHALGQALKVIFDTFALGKWTINKTMRNFFNTMVRACVYTGDC